MEPPAPEHASVKTFVVAVSAALVSEPEVGRLPLHAPLAVHAVAFAAFHVSVERAPDATVVGLAVSDSVGAGADAATVTVADLDVEPPEPVQVRVNVFVGAVSAAVCAEPESARLPLHAPLA